MSQKSIITIVIIAAVVLLGGGALFALNKNKTTSTTTTTTQPTNTMEPQQAAKEPTGSNPAVGTTEVNIQNMAFSPTTLTVKKGTKVTWTNKDSVQHDVKSDSGSELGSELLAKDASYSHTFDTVGTYTYHCSIHPSMKATVVVTE